MSDESSDLKEIFSSDTLKELFGDVKNNNNQNYITKGDSDSSASFDDLEKITKAIVINQDESDSLPTFSNEKKSLFETTDKTIINVPQGFYAKITPETHHRILLVSLQMV